MKNNIEMISIEKLYPHPDNPRKELGDLTELSESIKESGIFQNLTVVMHPTIADAYMVIIGHRRLGASKLAGLTELPCAVVEMTFKEQIATMLLENMQRSDLTILEQSQGIQMMIDLGESVEQISQKTGLSKSTIYKRKNIAELDQEESKRALQRGATLMDFVELEKIKDPGKKNELIEKMGTKDFRWILERAIADEKMEENTTIILDMLQDYTKETVMDYHTYNYKQLLMIETTKDPKDIVLPKIETDGEYIFTGSKYYIYLYKKTKKENSQNREQEQRDQGNKERKEAIYKLMEQSYQMRKEYITGLSNNRIKLSRKGIVAFLLAEILEDNYINLPSDYEEILQIPLEDILKGEDELEENEKLREEIEYNTERNLMLTTWLILDNMKSSFTNYRGEYKHNNRLEKTYQFVEMLGYECSEEEMQLRDGTHPLYGEEE